MRLAATLLCLTAAVLAAAVPASAASKPARTGVNIGLLNSSTTDQKLQADVKDAADLGANTIRAAMPWGDAEPARGDYTGGAVRALDTLFSAASARGIKVILVPYGSPCWASSAPDVSNCSDPDVFRYAPRDPADYGRFAAFLAGRYGDRLAAIEVWNEPDLEGQEYWKSSPADYAAMLKATYPLVKAASPSTAVLGGSLVGSSGKYLEALYKEGIKGSYDALAVHFYDTVLSAVTSIREIQERNGDDKPLWLTEFGWTNCGKGRSSGRVGGHNCVSDQLQAGNLLDIFRGLPKASFVDAAVIYEVRDTPVTQTYFGLLTADGKRKPSFSAATKGFAGRAGSPRKPTLKVSGGRVTGTVPAGDGVQVSIYKPGSTKPASSVGIRPNAQQRYKVKIPKGQWIVQAIQPFTGRKVEVTTGAKTSSKKKKGAKKSKK